MGLFDFFLKKVAFLQKRFPIAIIVLTLLVTAFLGYGITKVEFEGDLNKEMPNQLPIYKLNDRITDKFGGQDTIFILFMLDDTLEQKPMYNDIRNPDVMRYMAELDGSLQVESSINGVMSLAPYVNYMQMNNVPMTQDNIIAVLKDNPAADKFISSNKKIAIMAVKADVGKGETKVKALTNLIQNKIDSQSKPAGVKITITGSPSIIVTLLKLLRHDAVFTLIIASVIIFLLLLLTQRSFSKSILIFMPLLISLVWTIGTMGWLGINISIATAGLGAMVLGLGVEFGVFMLARYYEERMRGFNQEDAMAVSVTSVGSAIMGSGLTAIVGFLALMLSILPMLQHLGLSLAIGIAFSIFAAVIIEPAFIILMEDYEYLSTHRKHSRLSEKIERHKRMPR